MSKIVLEDFTKGNGYYIVNLAYLSKEQVEEIEALVSKWNPTDEDIKSCIGMCLTDVNEQRFKDYNTSLKDCLNWLEKQCQVKESTEIQHDNKMCKENDDSLTSYDERIGKDIVSFLRSKNGYMTPNEDWDFHNRWLPWFEKQGIKPHGSCDAKIKAEQNPAWSEEDDVKLNDTINLIEQSGNVRNIREHYISWLQSLKQRATWKPSNEQIKALRWVLNNVPYNKHKEEISGLLDQIKDL